MSEPRWLFEYARGDTVLGKFSCTGREVFERAVVSARFEDNGRPAFIGVNPNPPSGMGSGVWGYDDEIEEVWRG